MQALLAVGADSAALEIGRYDAVMIAAVAGDEQTLKLLLSLGTSAALITSRYDATALRPGQRCGGGPSCRASGVAADARHDARARVDAPTVKRYH